MLMPGRPTVSKPARCARGYTPGTSGAPFGASKSRKNSSLSLNALTSSTPSRITARISSLDRDASNVRVTPAPIRSPASLTSVNDAGATGPPEGADTVATGVATGVAVATAAPAPPGPPEGADAAPPGVATGVAGATAPPDAPGAVPMSVAAGPATIHGAGGVVSPARKLHVPCNAAGVSLQCCSNEIRALRTKSYAVVSSSTVKLPLQRSQVLLM